MNDDGTSSSEIQSPVQRVVILACFACFISLAFFYWAARPVVNLLAVPWIEFLAYALLPMTVTFSILYRSCWHREIAGAKRTCSLLLISCIILAGVIIGSSSLLYVAMFGLNALSGGNH
jgi:hypothetical protein